MSEDQGGILLDGVSLEPPLEGIVCRSSLEENGSD